MRLPLACLALLLTACPTQQSGDSSAAKTEPMPAEPAAEPAEPEQPAPAPAAVEKPPSEPSAGSLATVSADVTYPLPQILGKSPAEVEPKLGDPTGKGISRTSCIRFLPERTWFECEFAMQRYADPTGTYDAITVTYEDGVSTGIAFEGIPGDGDFDPKAALAHVGVELVGEPKVSTPADDVTLSSWFNAAARLLVHGKQYRVEVSSIGGTWGSSKVEFFLNHPLTGAQQAKVRTPDDAE